MIREPSVGDLGLLFCILGWYVLRRKQVTVSVTLCDKKKSCCHGVCGVH